MKLLRLVFQLLYHQFAWTYDLVATVYSAGRWKDWIFCALPHLQGRVLEIGFGPGHLQAAMQARGIPAFGLDESPQMARQAGRRLKGRGLPANLSRGYAQCLPFSANTFACVAATFPSEYIFEPQTLGEIGRVLSPGGRLVIIPSAWNTGKGLIERLAGRLAALNGKLMTPEAGIKSMEARLRAGGFEARHEIVEIKKSQVLVFIAVLR